jgi:cysteinyl-tRNA synthetase
MCHLGETFDLHGGGQDLVFPHHENEIAQSEAATGKQFARFWVHNGFVTVDQEKMSKSLGNFFTVREIFEKFPAPEPVTCEVLRYFLLATHYRHPIDFSDEALRQARAGINNFYDLFQRLNEAQGSIAPVDQGIGELIATLSTAFQRAMDDDFNTPAALAALQNFRSDVNTRLRVGLSGTAAQEVLRVFRQYGEVLGLFQVPFEDWEFKESSTAGTATLSDAEIERLIEERQQARASKNWARADEIRRYLADCGITIEDRPNGTPRWKR